MLTTPRVTYTRNIKLQRQFIAVSAESTPKSWSCSHSSESPVSSRGMDMNIRSLVWMLRQLYVFTGFRWNLESRNLYAICTRILLDASSGLFSMDVGLEVWWEPCLSWVYLVRIFAIWFMVAGIFWLNVAVILRLMK